MKELADIIRGRSVALVGNSERIIKERPAKKIDSADVVIRMNRGLPASIGPDRIGGKTTIWTLGRYWPDLVAPEGCEAILWMKLTPTGQREIRELVASRPKPAIFEWTRDLEKACHEFVGAPPGTGIRVLWYLRNYAEPRSISCYGMDCWEAPSHWSGRMNTPNHDPKLEREAMLKLL